MFSFSISVSSRFPLRFLIALLLGALHAAAFVDDHAWPIEIAALAGLAALALRGAREVEGASGTRRAAFAGARVGWAFGLGWFIVGISWIYTSLHTYGEMNPLLAGTAVVMLSAYLALYPALACALFAAFRHARRPGIAASVAAFAGLWALSEYGRGQLLTGFPWLASGYAHVAGPLAGYAPWVGVYGVSMAAAAVAAMIALAAGGVGARRERGSDSGRRAMVPLALIVFGIPLVGTGLSSIEWSSPSGKPIAVRLLQGNVAQDVKFREDRFDGIADGYMTMIEAKKADLIVLPETAFPRFLSDLPEALGTRLAGDAKTLGAAIAFGVPIYEGGDRYFNSVVALSPDAGSAPAESTPDRAATKEGEAPQELVTFAAQRYDKSHLVPFGEFIPFGFHWFVRAMNMPLGDFTRGEIDQKPMHLAGQRVAFNVCYEDLFGEEIIRQAGDANILVNVSNVAWFGDSMALPQHLDISRMRALETARPMLRATNTGMTAAIDPHGVVTGKLAPFTKGSLDVTVQGMTGLTPYTRFGNVPVLLLIGAALVIALVLPRRRRARDTGWEVIGG